MDLKTANTNLLKPTLAVLLLVFISACTIGSNVTSNAPDSTPTDSETEPAQEAIPSEPDRTWIVPSGPKQSLRERTWDLQHQKIWISFDFTKNEVIGTTELFLTSLTDSNTELILDSKTTQIQSIKRMGDQKLVPFVKDSAIVRIPFDENFALGDSIFISIEYVATPPNRGLYFVGPNENNPSKPIQVWTLGQPEDNSFWLPTIDNPSERTTTEKWIRVPETFTTVSNGKLIRSAVEPGDSLRTDYWVMDKPHAPYLIAIAAAEYSQASQFHNGVVLKYYAEPQFAPYLYSIYKDTDTMLDFFESKLEFPYPWETYSQVAVRDYIARGMENTTASIYFEHIQLTDRQQMDVSHQDLLVHELIHQWFGNLLTSKDWANLPLNEGFANYFETLFREFKDGSVSSQVKVLEDRSAYFNESSRFRRPIIFDQYSIPEDMYDRHTYEKMGLVLRQYHHLIGNQMWWEGLRSYIQDNQWNSVGWENLRDAFRKVTQENHDWYWEQWLLNPGHPELTITYDYEGPKPVIVIEQSQDLELQPLFRLNIPIEFQDNFGNLYKNSYQISERIHRIEIPMPKDSVSVIDIDPDRTLIVNYREKINDYEWISRLLHPSVMLRAEAVTHLSSKLDEHPEYLDLLIQAFELETVPEIRLQILQRIKPMIDRTHLTWIHKINQDSEDYYLVRILAADISATIEGTTDNNYLESLRNDKSYYVEKHIVNLIGQ